MQLPSNPFIFIPRPTTPICHLNRDYVGFTYLMHTYAHIKQTEPALATMMDTTIAHLVVNKEWPKC